MYQEWYMYYAKYPKETMLLFPSPQAQGFVI